jgi:hypothetical protein
MLYGVVPIEQASADGSDLWALQQPRNRSSYLSVT